jgi:hypothetical protein
VIMNVPELIDLLEDCDPEAFGSRTCRAGRWPLSCAAWPCPMTGRMRATRDHRKPARGSASWTAPSRSPSAVNTSAANARAGVPGRPVVCAVPRGHLTLSAAPPASLTHHHHPHRHWPFTHP